MSLKKSIGERIQLYRTVNGLTQRDLAKIAGRSKQLISAWESGRAEITVTTVVLLARRLGICPRWLLLADRDVEPREIAAPSIVGHVPFLTDEEIVDLATGSTGAVRTTLQMISTLHDLPRSCIAVRCMDDAMAPTLRDGDLVFLDTGLAPLPNSLVVAVIFRRGDDALAEPQVVVRRVHYLAGVSKPCAPVCLVADTPGWPTIYISSEEAGKVLGAIVGRQCKL